MRHSSTNVPPIAEMRRTFCIKKDTAYNKIGSRPAHDEKSLRADYSWAGNKVAKPAASSANAIVEKNKVLRKLATELRPKFRHGKRLLVPAYEIREIIRVSRLLPA